MVKTWISVVLIAFVGLLLVGVNAVNKGWFGLDKDKEWFGLEKVSIPIGGSNIVARDSGGTGQVVRQTAPTAGTLVATAGSTATLGGSYPIDNISVMVKNKYTMAAVNSVDVQFYQPGADVSDPNVKFIENITTIDEGVWSSSKKILQTDKDYDIYLRGRGTHYDELLEDFSISYNKDRGQGYLIVNGKSYIAARPVGSISDPHPFAESQSGFNTTLYDGCCSTATQVKNLTITVAFNTTASPAFIRVGRGNIVDGTFLLYNGTNTMSGVVIGPGNYSLNLTDGRLSIPTDGNGSITAAGLALRNLTSGTSVYVSYNVTPQLMTNYVAYDESALSGSVWFQMDIGNGNSDSEIHDLVLCFRDSDGDMEGDEVTDFTASFVSGSAKIAVPGNLLKHWKAAMGGNTQCTNIAPVLGPSEKARWEFVMTVSEDNWDQLDSSTYTNVSLENTVEEFELTFDDLGNYLKQEYPSSNTKATVQTVNITAMS